MHSRLIGGLAAGLAGLALVGCGESKDSGGLTQSDRNDAQAAMNALQKTNVTTQLLSLTSTAGLAPAKCRVHLENGKPKRFKLYVFWIPYIQPQSYSWLIGTIAPDPSLDEIHYGTAPTVPATGAQTADGQSDASGLNDYDTPLSKYGPAQTRKNQQVLQAHSGGTLADPGADCEVLQNGYLRLKANP